MRHKWIFAAVVTVVGLIVVYLLAIPTLDARKRDAKTKAFLDSVIAGQRR